MSKQPTTEEVANNIFSAFKKIFGSTVSILNKSFFNVSSKVLGGVFIILYKYAGFLGLQIYVRTASSKETIINGKKIIPLVEIGREIGVSDPKLAEPARFTIEIIVINQAGSLPAGSPLLSSKNGVTYITESSVVLDLAVIPVSVVAVADQSGGNGAGTIGDLDINDELSFINPQANVNQTASIIGIIQEGIDAEDLDTEYRDRVEERRKNPPQGGALADYVIWGTEVSGIINIYPYTSYPGQVDVYAEATIESSNEDGIPTQAQLDEIKNHIELNPNTSIATRRPTGAYINVYPIYRSAFDVKIFELEIDDEENVKNQIQQALTEYFLSIEPYIVGIAVTSPQNKVTQSAVGGVIQEVVSVFGGTFNTSEVYKGPDQISIYSVSIGEKTKLGNIEYIP